MKQVELKRVAKQVWINIAITVSTGIAVALLHVTKKLDCRNV